MPHKKKNEKHAREADAAALEPRASTDAMLLTLTASALVPIVQAIMSSATANAQRYHDAVRDAGAADAAGRAALAAAANRILR